MKTGKASNKVFGWPGYFGGGGGRGLMAKILKGHKRFCGTKGNKKVFHQGILRGGLYWAIMAKILKGHQGFL